jgi:hypothetical protein
MENPGYPDPDIMHATLVKSVLADTGIIPAADVNYEFHDSVTRHCWVKTFSKKLHSGLYVKFDPAAVPFEL